MKKISLENCHILVKVKVKVAQGEGSDIQAHVAKKLTGYAIFLLCFLHVSKLVLFRNM